MRALPRLPALATSSLLAVPSLALVMGALAVPLTRLFILALHSDSQPWTFANFATIAASRVERQAFLTTFELGFAVTALCAAIGIPLAFAMTVAGRRLSLLLGAAVTLPFWTALLVRTYIWLVILQRHGLVNQILGGLHLVGTPLSLVNNLTGTVIGMTHIMIPMFVFPVYAAFRSVSPELLRAALILGADRWTTFHRVILPLSAGGITSGATLVFVSSLGFYVTPIILGGGHVAVLSGRIERNITLFDDWGTASAIGVVLLVAVAFVLALAHFATRRGTGAHGRA